MPCADEYGVDHPAEDIPLEELPGEAPRLSPTGGYVHSEVGSAASFSGRYGMLPSICSQSFVYVRALFPAQRCQRGLWSIEWLRVYIALVIQSVWGSTARSRADGYMVGRQEIFIPMTT